MFRGYFKVTIFKLDYTYNYLGLNSCKVMQSEISYVSDLNMTSTERILLNCVLYVHFTD